mgnify:CR=1 FL=1|jgi:hypothetical protein
MVMYNNVAVQPPITKTSHGVLPFVLYLLIGNEKKYISSLETNPNKILSCMYEVRENQNLLLGIETNEQEFEVKVIWDKNFHDLDENHEVHILSPMQKEVVLFNFGQGTLYPWSIGYYLFEVEFDGKKYYGGFSISPKNISDGQFLKLHEFLNEKLEELTKSVLNFNIISQRDREFSVDIPSLLFFRWYELNEKRLFSAINMIVHETDSDRKMSYAIENVPRHLDRKSIIWKSTYKGLLYNYKILNRKYYENLDTKNNQIVKKRLMEILQRLEKAKEEVTLEIVNMDDHLKKSQENLKEIEIELIQQNNLVAKVHKKRLENKKSIEENKIETFKSEQQKLIVLYQKIEHSLKKLNSTLNNDFWFAVSHYKARGSIQSLGRGYLMFEQLYKSFKQFETGKQMDYQISPAFKPTAVLYEYFVYFAVIDSLQSLGFQFPKNYDLQNQLLSYLYKDGLSDGTAVKLISSELGITVYVVYNEEIETSSDKALKKNKSFFTNQMNNKPDIKLDLYIQKGEAEEFDSACIFEVKYRPLYNIYQEIGVTDAMIQMENYWAIKHVQMDGKISRSIVKDVICVYPGNQKKEILFEGDNGKFLQLFPEHDEESDRIIGMEEMKKLLSEWIEKSTL